MHAYSDLKHLLKQRQLSVSELHRRIRNRGINVNLKSLYRLSDDRHPLDRLDMRVAGAICSVFAVPLTDWIVFVEEIQSLYTLTPQKQERLDLLMAKNNQGEIDTPEREELRSLVHEAEDITLANARLLSQQRQHLLSVERQQ